MGLPAADLDLFIDLGDRLIANTDPDITDVVWGRDDTDAYRRFPFRSPRGERTGRAGVSEGALAPSGGARAPSPHLAVDRGEGWGARGAGGAQEGA
jgi:hypothetical protein